MSDIKNGNVFLVNVDGYGEPPRIFSTFNKAEGELLGHLRLDASRGNTHGFLQSIICIQIDTSLKKTTLYHGSIKIDGHEIILKISRDPKNECNCKAEWSEKLLSNLDYALLIKPRA
ncbi:hypothetical protein LCGC14_1251280 [marine sediment metagenome]|uniref:Uncharacterized protein n=1 Tax=marine sediment metagenome TaxID=412755 RepID=A0A0F9NK52_9ZZZZ